MDKVKCPPKGNLSVEFFGDGDSNTQIEDFLEELRRLLEQEDGDLSKNINQEQALDYFRILLDYRHQVRLESSNPDRPLTMARLEAIVKERKLKMEKIDLKSFVEDLRWLEEEGDYIAQKKKN